MKNKKIILVIGAFVCFLLSFITIVPSTYADEKNDNVVAKALLQGLAQCYTNGAFREDVPLEYVTSVDDILTVNSKTKNIVIPNGLVGSVTSNKMSCRDLMNGKSGISALFSGSSASILKNKTVIPDTLSNNDAATKIQFLENMGYVKNASSERCVRFKYVNSSSLNIYTHYICADIADGKISSNLSVKNTGSPDIVSFSLVDRGTAVEIKKCSNCSKHTGTVGTDWETFKSSLGTDLQNNRNNFNPNPGFGAMKYEFIGLEEVEGTDYALMKPNPDAPMGHMLTEFTGSPDIPRIENDDTAQLYVTYLINFYGADADYKCGDFNDEQKEIDKKSGYLEYHNNSKGEACYVRANKNQDRNVNGITDGKLNEEKTSFADVVDFLKNYTGDVDVDLDTASTLSPELTTENGDETCANSGGAESLGWIVCPVIKWLGDATNKIYDEYLEPNLQIAPQLFSEGNEGVRNGWDTFRNIANIVFIILFMFVIFSQVTGVGIDNYGIKKILPKMIVAAILINLSYLICVILVDISNIVGNGLQAMFEGLITNGGLEPTVTIPDSGVTDRSVATTAITGAAIAGAFAVMVGSIWTNPAVLLSLLVGLIGVVISLFFLFILLAAREAAIVVLIVLSPLAVVCYMLPNTKKYFDKWIKFFQGLLLVYPICGLLVGGGNYVSALLLSSGFALEGFPQALTAMVTGVIPIFFIPTVLKKSLNTVGELGSKISGLGKTVGSRAQGAVRNSTAYKNAQEAGRRRETRIRAGIDADGKPVKMNAFGRMIRGGNRGIARNRAAYLKDQSELANAERLMGSGFDAALSGIELNAQDKAISDQLTLMQNNGIAMKDGSTQSYSVASAEKRMKELENEARNRTLSSDEEKEIATLARGLASEKGGASKLNNIVRGAGNGKFNSNFMKALGNSYAQDATVRSKMNEKDGKIGSYMESFTPGGGGLQPGNERAVTFAEADAAGQLTDRAKSYEAKLNQGGQALQDTLAGFTRNDFQNIYDQELDKILDAEDLETFQHLAKDAGVEGKSDVQALNKIGDYLKSANATPSPSPSPAPSGSRTFTMQGASGEETFTQTADGRVLDSQGRAIDNPGRVIEQQRKQDEQQRKQDMYRNMSEEQLRSRANNAGASEAVRRNASDELRRRGLS